MCSECRMRNAFGMHNLRAERFMGSQGLAPVRPVLLPFFFEIYRKEKR